MEPVEVLKRYRTVAVVGASRDPSKWAHIVPKYLKEHGYRIIPINPTASEILGEKAYKSLMEVQEEVEVVEVFRPSEEVPKIAEEVIQRRKARGDVKVLWLQLGITADEDTKKRLKEAGIALVENACMMETHQRHLR
ncbi:MAG: CoA-binding protein [Pyrobaculum sp. OCT_11]|jgi:Predicted CoA-binding protein|nr:MAG: CoA-binding protein [Pyrobaculum sp. OCT_11]